MNRFCRFLIAVPAAFLAFAAAADDAVLQRCASCHGADGVAVAPPTPHLNGQHAGYLGEAMLKLQRGRTPTGVAEHIPATLAAADLERLAEFYASSKGVRPRQETDPEKVARGEQVYGSRCLNCHLDNGRDFEQEAPLLAAQSLSYLIEQNRLFASGKRKFAPRQDEAYKGLSERELEAVAHFFAAQEQLAAKAAGKKKQRR